MYTEAFSLLLVGMITVFFVLLLVLLVGQLLIRFTNRYFPVTAEAAAVVPVPAAPEAEVSPRQLAVLTAAVEAFTQGKGRIAEVRKLKN